MKWKCDRSHHCCILQVFNAGTHLCHTPPWDMIMFLIYYLGEDDFRGFHLTVSIMIALTPEARDTIWGWPQLPSVSIEPAYRLYCHGTYLSRHGRVLPPKAPTPSLVNGLQMWKLFLVWERASDCGFVGQPLSASCSSILSLVVR